MPNAKPADSSTVQFEPGSLRAKIVERTAHALQCGALQRIATRFEVVEQGGIGFIVRVVASLERKDQAKQAQKRRTTGSAKPNPFLPYDQDLFVADVSASHVCLLNKYNVVDHHLLLVTRAFEEQCAPLNARDFEALRGCLAEIDGLGFYNAGPDAGASQRHKHLQLVPLPLAPEGPRIPIEPMLANARPADAVGTIPGLPFVHAVTRLDPLAIGAPAAVDTLLQRYRAMLHAVGLSPGEGGLLGAYNLLVARGWMLLAPRSQESYSSIAINALGFAGALLARNPGQVEVIKNRGPLTLLRQVAVAAPAVQG